MTWTKPIVFKTGRKDCDPDPSLEKPFFTTRHEAHPMPHANGPWTTNYYKEHFNLTAREAICLQEGGHSFGKFTKASMFKYEWTRKQGMLLNNQLFRQVAERPQYYLECTDYAGADNFNLVGDAFGQPAPTTWVTTRLGFSVSGGPYQWFHRYLCNDWYPTHLFLVFSNHDIFKLHKICNFILNSEQDL